jgi:dephospho-CoA kinase
VDRLGLKTPVSAIGLTGGIGSGKSTVGQMLQARGARLVDTDAIAHALTQPGGAAMPALVDAFGPEALAPDGSLHRAYMRRRAFADAATKARLESILHPLIGLEAERQGQSGAGQPVVFDVPLLAESSRWRARVDRVLVIDCSVATQQARVALRPGWSDEAAARVIAQQASRDARLALADAVVFNEGLDLAQLEAEVDALWMHWMDRPGAP